MSDHPSRVGRSVDAKLAHLLLTMETRYLDAMRHLHHAAQQLVGETLSVHDNTHPHFGLTGTLESVMLNNEIIYLTLRVPGASQSQGDQNHRDGHQVSVPLACVGSCLSDWNAETLSTRAGRPIATSIH